MTTLSFLSSLCRFILLGMIQRRTFLLHVSAWMSQTRGSTATMRNSKLFATKATMNPDVWKTAAMRGGSNKLFGNGVGMHATSGTMDETSENKTNNNDSKLREIAEKCVSITGSSLRASTFCGEIPYYDTSNSNEFRVLFILGGPGAGKGTQSDFLKENYPCVHLSAGELLRKEQAQENSPHRELIEKCLVSGKIVPVEISLSLLEKAMREAAEEKGKSLIFLVDGFPRNFDNIDGWSRCMEKVACVLGVLVYQCPLEVLEQRILSRAKEGSGRSDDNLESARKRFVTFETDTVPVIDTLRLVEEIQQQNNLPSLKVADIQGNQPIQKVWQDTQVIMNQFIQNEVLTAHVQLFNAIDKQDFDLYERLCADEWFETKSAEEVMKIQEGGTNSSENNTMSNVKIDFISGTNVAVSYDRQFFDEDNNTLDVREKRIWSYRSSKGWQNIHFERIPQLP